MEPGRARVRTRPPDAGHGSGERHPRLISDGGEFLEPEKAVERALQLLAEGADFSTLEAIHAPGSCGFNFYCRRQGRNSEQEQDRVLPVIAAIKRERPEAVVSIDTYKSSTAMEAAGRRGDRQRR